MSLQYCKETKMIPAKPCDYRKSTQMGLAIRFLFECSYKLKAKPLTSASAAIIYHRFFKEVSNSDYDEYIIAASSIYLAGKIRDDIFKIRDVINVTYNTLNPDAVPLELGDEYWSVRDAIVQGELLIARTLKFNLHIEHPLKYLLYYMNTLQDWLGTHVWNSVPIPKAATSFLQDFHHSPKILTHKASHIAISCLSLAMQAYGLSVPLTEEWNESSAWYHAYVQDLTRDTHWEIMEDIMDVYKIDMDQEKIDS